MKFELTINTDSQAFREMPIKMLTRTLQDQVIFILEHGHSANDLRDADGNTIGKWRLKND